MRTLVFIAACVPLSLATLAGSEPSGGFGFSGSAFSPPPASNFNDSRDRVEVSVVADRKQVAPGGDLVLAVIFDQQPTWHIHTEDPQVPPELGDPEDFKATYIAVTSSDGRLVPHDNWIQWPQPHEIDVAFTGKPVPYTVFSGRAIAWVPVTVPADATTGPAELVVRAAFQACDDRVCAAPTPQPPPPGEQPSQRWIDYGWSISINIVPLQSLTRAGTANETDFAGFNGGVFGQIRGGETSPDTSADDVTFDAFGLKFGLDTDATFGIVLLLLVAAVGGFLLNLTPCVLPVIPLKIMAISSSGGSRRRTLMLGVAMSAGVIGFWIGIGLAIALLTGFTASNQLFQYPIFTIGIGIIIAVMAIGMCGLFSVRLPSAVYMVSPKHDTMSGSFLFGIMTAVLATPCTAPFMGAAMAWAATESPSVTLVTFAAIGIGMSLPYLFLAAFPKLTDRMPKARASKRTHQASHGTIDALCCRLLCGSGVQRTAGRSTPAAEPHIPVVRRGDRRHRRPLANHSHVAVNCSRGAGKGNEAAHTHRHESASARLGLADVHDGARQRCGSGRHHAGGDADRPWSNQLDLVHTSKV